MTSWYLKYHLPIQNLLHLTIILQTTPRIQRWSLRIVAFLNLSSNEQLAASGHYAEHLYIFYLLFHVLFLAIICRTRALLRMVVMSVLDAYQLHTGYINLLAIFNSCICTFQCQLENSCTLVFLTLVIVVFLFRYMK